MRRMLRQFFLDVRQVQVRVATWQSCITPLRRHACLAVRPPRRLTACSCDARRRDVYIQATGGMQPLGAAGGCQDDDWMRGSSSRCLSSRKAQNT